jgi:CubicO group peptidase (beta-lactamase class C family)
VPIDHGEQAEGVDWEALDSFVVNQMQQACIPGVSVSLVDANGTRFVGAYGWADLEAERPLTVDTPCMMASASKMVVGLSLAVAATDGDLSLHDPVTRHVDFPLVNPRIGTDQAPIRLSHLATHSSGIADNWDVLDRLYRPGDPLSGLAYFLPEYLVRGGRWYSGSKNFHRWAPGDAWMYSNVGAALAAHAVEGATGTRFKRYSHRKFFGPLGMDHSEWFLEDLRERDIEPAVPYTFDRDDRWKAVEHYGFPTWPDGQLRSTARDMGMLLRLVLGNGVVDGTRVVSPEAVDLLLSRPQGDLSEWYLSEFMLQQRVFWFDLALGDRTLTGHDGDDIGVSSEVFYDRTSGVGVALVMNLADGERDGEPRAATVAIQQRLFALGESL